MVIVDCTRWKVGTWVASLIEWWYFWEKLRSRVLFKTRWSSELSIGFTFPDPGTQVMTWMRIVRRSMILILILGVIVVMMHWLQVRVWVYWIFFILWRLGLFQFSLQLSASPLLLIDQIFKYFYILNYGLYSFFGLFDLIEELLMIRFAFIFYFLLKLFLLFLHVFAHNF